MLSLCGFDLAYARPRRWCQEQGWAPAPCHGLARGGGSPGMRRETWCHVQHQHSSFAHFIKHVLKDFFSVGYKLSYFQTLADTFCCAWPTSSNKSQNKPYLLTHLDGIFLAERVKDWRQIWDALVNHSKLMTTIKCYQCWESCFTSLLRQWCITSQAITLAFNKPIPSGVMYGNACIQD